ncbi:MAG TPA: hypothetical protein VFC15_08550 [Candidatus Limnocylindrales bacterium]|nr:hypothetical protein [Candidatus Limnocylindrales bacterium]
MNWKNPRSVEATITRLTREIAKIDEVFYMVNETDDRVLYAGMLERKRDDVVRAAVLQMHTAIEDLLNSQIICRILNVKPQDRARKMRSKLAQALRSMLVGPRSLGFEMKLNFAVVLGIVRTGTKDRLTELNTLRNKCSHNWLLKAPVRRGKRPKQKKSPLLLYRGRDLYNVDVLAEFLAEYGPIYYKLFGRYLDL